LDKDLVDAVIVAGMDPIKPWRVKPMLTDDIDEVKDASQSKIAIVPTNAVLKRIGKKKINRIAMVGLPCHIHGIRKMEAQHIVKNVSQRIKFTFGLLCGANYTYRATEHVIQEVCKMPLETIQKVEYRGGPYPGNFRVTSKDGTVAELATATRRVFFQGFLRDRCTMCYDYANEFADISIGDYFDRSMSRGTSGWSTLMVRTERGQELLNGAEKENYITTESSPYDHSIGNIGFEFKMHGYGYHLLERKKHGWPVPEYGYPLQTDVLLREVYLKHPHIRG
jgi:coenzyme F420 hydrogenase subunit beta